MNCDLMKNLFSFILCISCGCFSTGIKAVEPPDSMNFLNWAPTPPMGWNSWDCYGPTVVENEVKSNADYMARHMKKAGWEYIVVDIRWFVENDKAHGYNETDPRYTMDAFGRFLPSEARFPSC